MIIRILGEGQYEVADAHMDELNKPDTSCCPTRPRACTR
ncbi:PspA-associated protein PspAA [Streptomyces sp. NPDC002787]